MSDYRRYGKDELTVTGLLGAHLPFSVDGSAPRMEGAGKTRDVADNTFLSWAREVYDIAERGGWEHWQGLILDIAVFILSRSARCECCWRTREFNGTYCKAHKNGAVTKSRPVQSLVRHLAFKVQDQQIRLSVSAPNDPYAWTKWLYTLYVPNSLDWAHTPYCDLLDLLCSLERIDHPITEGAFYEAVTPVRGAGPNRSETIALAMASRQRTYVDSLRPLQNLYQSAESTAPRSVLAWLPLASADFCGCLMEHIDFPDHLSFVYSRTDQRGSASGRPRDKGIREQVRSLLEQGVSQKEIAVQMGKSKSWISKLINSM
ncbi:helix-turn-helix domain-containing protein [Ectothiorhodospiraceae bacterium WFHF3C12]|nr:helix-turn-helix domain-containing protein [Ectothiorhodospiraceae bacterium WFHF3C12]